MDSRVFKQQTEGLYAVNISSPGSIFNINQLTELISVAKDLGITTVKCGVRQTLIFLVKEEKIAPLIEVVESLNLTVSPFGSSVRSVKVCAGGEGLCPRKLGNALELGIEIEKKYTGQNTPKDFKISTAGCARGCTEPYCADFGAIATGKDTFEIVIGGRGSTKKPIHGKQIAKNISRENVFAILDYVLDKYRQLAQPHERLCSTIERVGLEEFIPSEKFSTPKTSTAVDSEFADFLLS